MNNLIVWFTGLSGSGKTTIAKQLEIELFKEGVETYTLDGDTVRKGLNKDIGFSSEDRKENIRRIGEVSKILIDAGVFVLATFISPYEEDRKIIKDMIGDKFIDVYVKCSIEECERRDPKGLYKKVRNGEIKQFTGISSPYEEPTNPDIVIDTEKVSLKNAVKIIESFIGMKI